MKMYPRSGEKRRFDDIDVEDEEEAIGTLCRMSSGGGPGSPCGGNMENEKRMRREIANSNERRRMQSINAGFSTLKKLLPHSEGEKLSKAAILQQTADYIKQLEDEANSLKTENVRLKQILNTPDSTDGSSSDGEGQMNEILSTIQDLHNNPTASKLPNTEFHQQQNITSASNTTTTTLSHNKKTHHSSSNKCHVVEQQQHHRLSSSASPQHHDTHHLQHHRIVEDIAAVEEVPMVPCHDDPCKDQQTTYLSVGPVHADSPAGVPGRRNTIDGSNKQHHHRTTTTLLRYPAKMPKMECSMEETTLIKNEPIEYGTTLEQYQLQHHGGNKVVVSGTRCYTIHTPTTTTVHPNATIVTILPPTPPHPNSMPAMPLTMSKVGSKVGGAAVMEVVSGSQGGRILLPEPRVEVEPASRIPTPDEIEYSAGELSPPHSAAAQHMHHDGDGYPNNGGMLVTSCNKSGGNAGGGVGGQSCQKSLDTICEAIRHLEGEHMFPVNEEPGQGGGRIEEEVITEETYAIHDSSQVVMHDEVPFVVHQQQHHFPMLRRQEKPGAIYENKSGAIYENKSGGVYEICASPPTGGPSGGGVGSGAIHGGAIQFHPSTTMVYGIDEHLICSSEPQEAPLELTTNARLERISSPPLNARISSPARSPARSNSVNINNVINTSSASCNTNNSSLDASSHHHNNHHSSSHLQSSNNNNNNNFSNNTITLNSENEPVNISSSNITYSSSISCSANNNNSNTIYSTSSSQHQQHSTFLQQTSRPGVIVVKQT